MNFHIDSTCYRRPAPSFEEIKVKGYFSLTDDHSIRFDSSQLRYYKERKYETIHFDLNEGIENIIPYTNLYMNRNIDKILYWIREFYERIAPSSGGEKWLEPDFICRRGVIWQLLRTPYEERSSWIICAAKWRGSIYLCLFFSDANIIDGLVPTSSQSASTSWGHKFEQCILSDTADGLPDTAKPVDQNAQFCCIFQSCLGKHSLLYVAEMDGICAEKTLQDPLPLDELKFIELKTYYIVDNPRSRKKFAKYNTLKVWGQCVPVGIDNVLCGFKNSQGIVTELATFNLTELTNLSKFYWHPRVSINFANDFLTHIASAVINNCDETIYKFEKREYSDVIEMTEVSPTSEYSFLPDWYKYDDRY